MEMVFDLRYRRLFALSWERGVRGCILLIAFGILYLCVRACPMMNEIKHGGIEVNSRMNEISGIESENVCDNRKHVFIGFQEQGVSLVTPDSGEMKKSVKTVEAETPKIKTEYDRAEEKPEPMNFASNENIFREENIDKRFKPAMVENNVTEIVVTPEYSDSSVGTSELDMKNDGTHETLITGSDVTDIITAPESSGSSTEAAEPDADIKKPEVTEEIEINDPIISDGFSIDTQGYITGITDSLVLLDEILIISADQRCVGIRESAFSDVEGIVTEIYIPANIHDIEPGAFRYFQDLMYIEVSEFNPYYSSVDGILYSKSGEEILCPIGR